MQIQPSLSKRYLCALSLLGCLGGVVSIDVPAANAEGSRELTNNTGNRPYLEYRNDLNGGILRRTIMKVYANEGETIDLASSAVGLGNGVINYRDPNNVAGTCGPDGLIASRAEEVAGPGDGTGGTYIPCTVAVGPGQGGIWEIDFVSPNQANSGANPPSAAATVNWTQANNTAYVYAWDITVRSAGGAAIPGRAYANYYAFNMGRNGVSLSSEFTVLTQEGYQYGIDLNGLDPFGFIFFANRNGFFDVSTGDSIFRSLQFVGANPGQLPTGYSFHNPNDPDVGIYVTHKTFINPPDAAMPSTANSPSGLTWLFSAPTAPPVPSNFAFNGEEGTSGVAGTAPLGGILSFDSTNQNAFSITIDLNNDGLYGTGNDRTFIGRSVVGPNSVFWDGLDGNGAPVPASTIPYGVRINQYAGEAHFPMIDAEQNPAGIVLERLNTPPGPTSISEHPNNIYYDDRNTGSDFTLCASGESGGDCYGGAPSPRESLTGLNSTGGGHAFTANFGNRRGIDTWVYYPSTDVELNGGIVIREADIVVDKTVDFSVANPGDPLTYTVTVRNDGPSDEDGIGFQDTVPASLNSVNWSCVVTSGNGSCGDASGSGNTINTTLNLENGAEATYTISGILDSNASGTITNSATAIRNLDITDPDESNNTDSASTTITSVPPPGTAVCYSVADAGDTLVSININTGAETAIGPVGVPDIEAIAFWPVTDTLFAANASQLGTLNRTTGAYNNIGSFGSGSGSAGGQSLTDVKGLAVHPFTGQLFGVHRRNGSQDLLFEIDPSSGLRVANAFGSGVDYQVIQSVASTGFNDIDDIAIDPDTGELYGIANDGGTSADRFIRIDPTTGATTAIGSFGVSDMEGLTVFNNGQFFGTTGNESADPSEHNVFYSINKVSGVATEIDQLSISADYESVACLTGAPNGISGTVFLDPNTNGVLDGGDSGTQNATVRLLRDRNGNGQVDGSDSLLAEQATLVDGTYNYLFAANGSFVLDVVQGTLPADNNTFTTDNLEVASFGNSFGQTDTGNNFGHFTDSNLALVKRITAINGVRLTDSVDVVSDGNDNHPNWPVGTTAAGISSFLAGAAEHLIEPGDEVEYTIYYLATGNFPVTNVRLCDRVPDGTTYVPESMVLFTSGNTSNLTDTDIDGDGARFLSAGNSLASLPCPGSNNPNGAIEINLAPSPAQLPNATGPGTPNDSYGFIRFRAVIDNS